MSLWDTDKQRRSTGSRLPEFSPWRFFRLRPLETLFRLRPLETLFRLRPLETLFRLRPLETLQPLDYLSSHCGQAAPVQCPPICCHTSCVQPPTAPVDAVMTAKDQLVRMFDGCYRRIAVRLA